MPYNMYHKRPLDAQNAQPIPMPGGGRSDRLLKERSDQAGSKGAAARRAWQSKEPTRVNCAYQKMYYGNFI